MDYKNICPWDAKGSLKPNITVRHFVEYLQHNGNHANITINGVYYDLHNLLISTPCDIDMESEVIAIDYGYYGTPGIKTI